MDHAAEDDEETARAPDNDALDALRWNWGDAYEIEVINGEWRARRRDGLGGWITAPGADELSNKILSDYMFKPVLRSSSE